MIAILERLVAANISLVPLAQVTTHFVFERDGYAALVQRRGDAFGGIGAPGRLTDQGLAMLVWRGDRAYFVTKSAEQEASETEVLELRRFATDLQSALHS